jgi:hypothetical protein
MPSLFFQDGHFAAAVQTQTPQTKAGPFYRREEVLTHVWQRHLVIGAGGALWLCEKSGAHLATTHPQIVVLRIIHRLSRCPDQYQEL